ARGLWPQRALRRDSECLRERALLARMVTRSYEVHPLGLGGFRQRSHNWKRSDYEDCTCCICRIGAGRDRLCATSQCPNDNANPRSAASATNANSDIWVCSPQHPALRDIHPASTLDSRANPIWDDGSDANAV